MNILIFNWRGPKHPNSGGAEIATLEHAKYWVSKGHSVTWFTSSFWGNKKQQQTIDGVKVIRRANQILGVHFAAIYWYLFESKDNFDLVVDQFHGIPFFTPLYVRTKKIGFIHEVTKDVWKKNHLPKPLNTIPAIFGELVEAMIFRLIYFNISFFTVSESTKEDLESFGIKHKNIKVIHNGIRSIKAKSKKNTKPTILYLGALAKDKGLDDLVSLFVILKNKHKDWNIWVAGKGSPEYVEILKKHNIKYFGFVSEEQKFELFKKAHLFVNLSIREGWGLTNIEANTQGTPVVGYSVPGLRDSVVNNETGILVQRGDINSLQKNIEKLISDKTKYKRLSKNALNWSKKFNWKEAGKQSLGYLQEVLASS